MNETEVPDPALYGAAWRPMADAPRDASVLTMLLVPNRPDIKVVRAVRVGARWILADGSYLPDDQPPIGWMSSGERHNWHMSIEDAAVRPPPEPDRWPRKPTAYCG